MSEAVQATLPEQTATSSLRIALTLAVAGLLSGLILVVAYEFSQPMIEAHRREALRRAVFKVVPGATRMMKLSPKDGALVPAAPEDKGEAVYAAWDDTAFLGWAVAGEGAGFQDTIRLLWGLTPDTLKVQGLEVIDSRETPGLGDRIYKDPAFAAEFSALATDPTIQVVANGQGSLPNHVDGITGATISSKAVVAIINAGNSTWRAQLPKDPGVEPPAPAPAQPGGEP